jgi:hypothetical protein
MDGLKLAHRIELLCLSPGDGWFRRRRIVERRTGRLLINLGDTRIVNCQERSYYHKVFFLHLPPGYQHFLLARASMVLFCVVIIGILQSLSVNINVVIKRLISKAHYDPLFLVVPLFD